MSRSADLAIRLACRALCRLDTAELSRLPKTGPYLLVTNHINFLEIPILRSHLLRHRMTALVKAETWDSPLMAWLFSQWRAIPLRRETTDFQALRAGLQALREGWILAIAPEGTRSRDGKLLPAHSGVSLLALHSGVPVYPLVCYGQENFGAHARVLRRTPVSVRVGPAFRVKPVPGRLDHRARDEITEQIMNQLARLLPPGNRGHYPHPEDAPTGRLEFLGNED